MAIDWRKSQTIFLLPTGKGEACFCFPMMDSTWGNDFVVGHDNPMESALVALSALSALSLSRHAISGENYNDRRVVVACGAAIVSPPGCDSSAGET